LLPLNKDKLNNEELLQEISNNELKIESSDTIKINKDKYKLQNCGERK
jgi:hypothetical protein